MKPKRKRGAPYGNKNAVKHGFYSKSLGPADRFDLRAAADMEGVDEEIALLRFEIRKVLAGGDVLNLVPLAKAAFALEKLIRTRRLLLDEKRPALELAVANVIRHVLLPLGPGITQSVIESHLTKDDPDDRNQKNK